MADNGITVKSGDGMTRVEVTCGHQSGLIYVVPASRSWVCSEELIPAHALAGFFRELVALKLGPVAELMQDWGIYYRQLPLALEENSGESIDPAEASKS
ncbi:MAG: hypothetical protein BZY68_02350 [SAR202 cluster bacterium MP-SAtl-SRR3965592-G2]|jgi:hypothetical protein|nr:MAG: hypothetical protein BZY68_02350 [SAR202 cluster bacterium MP-SAtl-SRR3965592-G2]HIM81779.1 hypothetical protein [Dehalococcoidia bacterium]|tara:strand:- start:61 stop:357 length:297 start_codon:yes stop_codon:yes gene_type:complete